MFKHTVWMCPRVLSWALLVGCAPRAVSPDPSLSPDTVRDAGIEAPRDLEPVARDALLTQDLSPRVDLTPPEDLGATDSAVPEDLSPPEDLPPLADRPTDSPAPTPDTPMIPVARPTRAGTLVVLGDSISDGGGEPPYFYDLLVRNNDGLYPAWRGLDLSARFGALRVVHAAMSGSTTSGLEAQVRGLSRALSGDLIVTITSGGNDIKNNILLVVAGLDAAPLAAMGANLRRALDELTRPGRLGSGRAYIFEGNIYDASDGRGDFAGRCAFASRLPVVLPSDPYFGRWNGVIATEVRGHGGALADMHTLFRGHGYASREHWYTSDCTHPNRAGHHQLRRHFWQLITGETPPP